MENKILACIFSSAIILGSSCQKPSDYANPLVGCSEYGHCHPCACTPFGMIQTGPVSGNCVWAYTGGYQYRDTVLFGFSNNRINGTGCPDLGDLLVYPFCKESEKVYDPLHGVYASYYRKETQDAAPGWYRVYLDDAGVDAEMTCTEHVAYHKYVFDDPEDARILLDLQDAMVGSERSYHKHVKANEINFVSPTTINGWTRTDVWVDRTYYYTIEFSKPYTGYTELEKRDPAEVASRYVIGFDLEGEDELEVKISISAESIGGSAKNISAELPEWNFKAIKKAAYDAWNKELGRVTIKGTETEKNIFYTSMYHIFVHPNNVADNGNDPLYSTLSLWDTYRAEHPILTIIAPEYVDKIVNSMLEMNDRQGFLPIWSLWGMDNYCMIGDHSVPVIVDAFLKGFDGFDAERAYKAIKHSLVEADLPKTNWKIYDEYGYFPFDLVPEESVSRTLECCYDDWCAAQMAKALGYEEDYEFFMRRSEYYKNVYDPAAGMVRGRDSKGGWRTPFNRFQNSHSGDIGGDFTEGNAWQYNWHIQHAVPEMIAMNGGKEKFVEKLDSLFTMGPVECIDDEEVLDVTGLIGQYAHGNEPSHHVAYLYRLAGCPERGEELLREITETMYLDDVNGLCGNDDCGQMSAWYVFTALGFYPVNPCGGEFVFGAPQIKHLTINLPDGKKFVVKAKNLSKENKYVKSIALNGKTVEGDTIDYSDIMKGGELVFTMGS